MKILHTSDWHLGRSLYGKKRYEEFEAFLDWLVQVIAEEKVDVLLVAGDIFDTATPGNRAQELYYNFLFKVSSTSCRQVVVTAGNHDSPSFLNAPRALLKVLNVFVVGSMTESLSDEVIVLHKANQPAAIICAVPYLRDKDIRTVEAGETIDAKNAKLIDGIKQHYSEVCQFAEAKRIELNALDIPLIAMGHLFTAGGKTIDGDGVRELYVGSLNQVLVDIFPSSIDYLALGHLHIPQIVAGKENIRYSGSPIPMGFGEAKEAKKVILIDFAKTKPSIQELTVPTFQKLIRIVGTVEEILLKIEELKAEDSNAWLEIEYQGSNIVPDLRELIESALADSTLEVRRIKNKQLAASVAMAIAENETLADLTVEEVFQRCLKANAVTEEEKVELIITYNEIIKELLESDQNAE